VRVCARVRVAPVLELEKVKGKGGKEGEGGRTRGLGRE